MAWYLYRVVSVPNGCTEYVLGQEVELDVPEPPRSPLTIGEGVCAGVVVVLVSEPVP